MRSTRTRLAVSLRRSEEALSPRELRKLLADLSDVADPARSEVFRAAFAQALPDMPFHIGEAPDPAAVRWLTPFSCRRRDRVRENSAFKFLTSNENQYTWYSINDGIPVVKSIFLFSAKFLHKTIEIIAKWKGSFPCILRRKMLP